MKKRAVIIDCDPGIDDAVNLFLAISAPSELDILGITAVAGNVPVQLAAANACFIRDLAGRPDIPVYLGCERPLRRPLNTAEAIHGETGLGPIAAVKSKHPPVAINAVDFIEKALIDADHNGISLVASGPLTNIAAVINRRPEIAYKIAEIIVMGGASREAGNCTPSAEFNIYADPHAADIVFRCARPIVVHGLDATHQVGLSAARRDRIARISSTSIQTLLRMLDHFNLNAGDRHQGDGVPLHDPCTIAYLLDEDLFSGMLCNLSVETESELTMGHTAVDFWRVTDRVPNVKWIYSVNADGFYDLLIARLRQFATV